MRVKNGRSSIAIRRSTRRDDSRWSVPWARVILEMPSCRSHCISPARPSRLILARPPAPLGLRQLADPLVEAPAVAFEVERLVGAIAREMIAQLVCQACARGERALKVRVDIGNVTRR